jgi:probable phosphoglycerate mutase
VSDGPASLPPIAEGSGTLYLVRHGEAAASWGQSPDPGLSDLGREQASTTCATLAEALDPGKLRIVSSPLLRARETAAPLVDCLGRPLEIDERFREIPSPVPLAERQTWLRGFMQGRWSDQADELKAWRHGILEAVSELPDGCVVFTHFLVLNTVVGWIEGRDETLSFWPANASVTRLSAEAGLPWQVERGEQMRSRVN